MSDKKALASVKAEIKTATTGDLATVGLLALIDEATGYQTERFKDDRALRKELASIMAKRVRETAGKVKP